MAAHSKLRKVENSAAGSKREGALSRYWMLALAIGAWAVMKLAQREDGPLRRFGARKEDQDRPDPALLPEPLDKPVP